MSTVDKEITIGDRKFTVSLSNDSSEATVNVKVYDLNGVEQFGVGGGRPKCPPPPQ